MEYELVYQPLMNVSDGEMHRMITSHMAGRFPGKTIAELSTSEKCSILKSLFFSHKTTIPQLSRIMGLPRELVRGNAPREKNKRVLTRNGSEPSIFLRR